MSFVALTALSSANPTMLSNPPQTWLSTLLSTFGVGAPSSAHATPGSSVELPLFDAACKATDATAIVVAGAGTEAANGVYSKTAQVIQGEPMFQLDDEHQIYVNGGGEWRELPPARTIAPAPLC